MEKMAGESRFNGKRATLLRLGYVTRLSLNSIDRADRFFFVRNYEAEVEVK